jgi:hypothetical protein
VNCAFCDAPVGDDAERCPSCSAILRRTCPSCGKINPVHVETCFACGKALPALPAAPEPTGVDPVEAPKPPLTAGSIVLRAMGFLLLLLAFFAAVGSYGTATVLNCLLFSFLFFCLARLKESTDGTWEVVNRIESQLNNRSRRR